MRRQLWTISLSVCLVMLAGLLRPTHAAEKPSFSLSADEEGILTLVNKERKDRDLAPLQPNEKLFKAARDHSANMAKQEKLSHDLDGKSPADRMADVGYRGLDWGENCATGQRTPAQVLSSWMNSDGHRANILNGRFTEAGIGAASSAQGTPYYTLVLAVGQDGPPADPPSAPAKAEPAAADPNSARLVVRLPVDGEVYLDGRHLPAKGENTGEKRNYDTPPLQPGRQYAYTIRVEVTRDGQKASDNRSVTVRAGQTTEVDFTALDARLPKPKDAGKPAGGSGFTFPQGQPPTQAVASLDKEGRLMLKYRVTKPVFETGEKERVVDGKVEKYPVTLTRWVFEEHIRQVETKDVQVFDVAGKKIDAKRLPELLAKETGVLIAEGDLMPDPAYLQFYKDGTLVLMLPLARPMAKGPA